MFKMFIYVTGLHAVVSMTIHAIQNTGLWYSRYETAILCAGFAAIIEAIENRDKND
jgi:hypothetical protein